MAARNNVVTQMVTHNPQSRSQSQICAVVKTGRPMQPIGWGSTPAPPRWADSGCSATVLVPVMPVHLAETTDQA